MKKTNRFFRIGERVFNCDYNNSKNHGFGVIVQINGKSKNGNILFGDDVSLMIGDRVIITSGENVYKIAPRISKKVGEIVCYEHRTTMGNYPFYMPSNDENYYRIELGL